MRGQLLVIFLLLSLGLAPAHTQLRGHGGPVRALSISPDGQTAVSGSFDSSAIRWSLQTDTAEQVLRFHDSRLDVVGRSHCYWRRRCAHRYLAARRTAPASGFSG